MLQKLKSQTYKLLRQSEKWTKTDMVYLAKGSSWMFFNQLTNNSLYFISSIAIANFLSKETYGTYTFLISTITLLSIPTLTGMNDALKQAIARGFEKSIYPAIKLKIKWGLIGSLGGIAISLYYLFNGNHSLFFAFLLISLLLPFFESFNVYSALIEGRKDFKTISKISILNTFIYITLFIVLIYFSENVILLLLYFLISKFLFNFFFFRYTINKYKPNDRQDDKTLGYGKFLSFFSIINLIANEIDKIILWHFLGAKFLAIFSFATTPVKLLTSSINHNVSTLAFPKLSQTDIKILKKTLPIKTFKFALLLVPVFFAYYFISPIFFKIFYPQYIESVSYSQFYALMIMIIPFTFFGSTLIAKMSKRKLTLRYIISPIFKIGLFILLIPKYGLNGLIISNIIGGLFNGALSYILFKY